MALVIIRQTQQTSGQGCRSTALAHCKLAVKAGMRETDTIRVVCKRLLKKLSGAKAP